MGGLAFAVLLLSIPAQFTREKRIEEYKEERTRVRLECGQRHLEYALELRDKGLVVQSAAQIVIAVEVAEGKHPGANLVLRIMRTYEDAFWRRKPAAVTAARLQSYEQQAAKLRLADQEQRLELVKWAQRKDLDEQAYSELVELLLARDEPLAIDAKGALVLPGGTLGGALAERVKATAILINDEPYVRDLVLRRLPEVTRLFEVSSATLRVRSTTSVEEARALHGAAAALIAHLREDLGASPDRRLQLFVLDDRKAYDRYLDLADLSAHKVADGFADGVAATALLYRRGTETEGVLGLALHELTHLFQLAITPAALPSWFLEGSAERFGGQGTFAWDGKTLATRLPMNAARLEEVRAQPLSLRELLTTDALATFGDAALQRRFYAQSWALVTFLESDAAAELGQRYRRWRAMCLGSAIGADLVHAYAVDASASEELFLELFGQDLEVLEQAFLAWLGALR